MISADPVLQDLSKMRVSPKDTRLLLPEEELEHYDQMKVLLLRAGGKYSRGGFSFPKGGVQDIVDRLLAGEEVHPQKERQSFFTPEVVRDMIYEHASPITDDMTVLEPSAGDGALIPTVGRVTAVELDFDDAAGLQEACACDEVICGDFLTLDTDRLGQFDRILANPPFAKDQDIKHVTHMLKFLKPGGRLVSVMSGGWQTNFKKAGEAFRALIGEYAYEVIDLEAGAFKENGTMVSTTLLVLDKIPAAQRFGPGVPHPVIPLQPRVFTQMYRPPMYPDMDIRKALRAVYRVPLGGKPDVWGAVCSRGIGTYLQTPQHISHGFRCEPESWLRMMEGWHSGGTYFDLMQDNSGRWALYAKAEQIIASLLLAVTDEDLGPWLESRPLITRGFPEPDTECTKHPIPRYTGGPRIEWRDGQWFVGAVGHRPNREPIALAVEDGVPLGDDLGIVVDKPHEWREGFFHGEGVFAWLIAIGPMKMLQKQYAEDLDLRTDGDGGERLLFRVPTDDDVCRFMVKIVNSTLCHERGVPEHTLKQLEEVKL